jgi:hypothetical protein
MNLALRAGILAVGAALYLALRAPLRKNVDSPTRLYELLRILLHRGLAGARFELFRAEGELLGVVRKVVTAVDEVYLSWSMSTGKANRTFSDAYEAGRTIGEDLSASHGIKMDGDCYGYLSTSMLGKYG